MMTTTERILILDGHTNQALACVRSLGQAGYTVLVASHQRFPLGAWSRYCKGSFTLRDQSVEAFAAMREWAVAQGVRIVLPLTERSCLLCNVERGKWESSDITIGCGPDEMLLGAFDKAQTIIRANAVGVNTPQTFLSSSLAECFAAADQIGFPLIVKARCSNAWDGLTFSPPVPPAYVNRADDLAVAVLARKQGDVWPLIQKIVEGKGKGAFALCDRGRIVAWFAHERLRDTRPTGSRSSLRRSIPLEPRLQDPAERLLRNLEWHGPAMVEFKDDEINPPCLMEINGRFWGSLQLGIDAGINFPLLWLSVLKGQSLELSSQYTEGVTLRWLWGDVKRLARILRGAPSGYTATYPTIGQGIIELLGPQPSGTRLEAWRKDDRWPAVGEWIGGLKEIMSWWSNGNSKSNGRGRAARKLLPYSIINQTLNTSRNNITPGVLVREATPTEVDGWDQLVARFDNHRVLHTLAWLRSLHASCVNGKPLFLIFERGGEIVGCLPGFLATVGFLRMFGSPLPGWQTMSMGPLFDPERVSTEELMAPLLSFLVKGYGVHHIELIGEGFDPQVMEDLRFTCKPSPSYCVPLFPGNEERVMKSFKDSARRNVRRAIKLGLVVKFEDDESFVDEHYDQLVEVYNRGGNMIPFSKKRALEFFRHMKASGNLLAVSVSLPDGGPCIATGTFTVDGRELLLWMWAHRTQHRWYRPTELMTWTVMQKAMERGCESLDLMGRGDFKPKLGALLNENRNCWIWSRYHWLTKTRLLAGKGYKWQQGFRGRRARQALFNRLGLSESNFPLRSEPRF